MKNNYVPFLKLKRNEIAALSVLEDEVKSVVIPFFDFPKRDSMTSEAFQKMVKEAAAIISRKLEGIDVFFLDTFDVDDSLLVDGRNNYDFVINAFSDMPFIPVVGLDRSADRNIVVFDGKKQGTIKSDIVAIRLSAEDFESFELVRDDIDSLVKTGEGLFSEWFLILDNRLCLNVDYEKRAKLISDFLSDAKGIFDPSVIVVAGSSLPPSIRDVISVESEIAHRRVEISVYREVIKKLDGFNIWLGDYTIVSPLYSDIDIPPEAIQNVIAAKIIYSYDDFHYVIRGGAIKTHARGLLQYNDIARAIVSKSFYRGAEYSFGDRFIDEKANNVGSGVTASSILKPTINTHITMMARDFLA